VTDIKHIKSASSELVSYIVLSPSGIKISWKKITLQHLLNHLSELKFRPCFGLSVKFRMNENIKAGELININGNGHIL